MSGDVDRLAVDPITILRGRVREIDNHIARSGIELRELLTAADEVRRTIEQLTQVRQSIDALLRLYQAAVATSSAKPATTTTETSTTDSKPATSRRPRGTTTS